LKDYFEELWAALPDALEPPYFDVRARFLLDHVTAGVRALDLGCGEGTFTAVLARAGADVVGADVADAALVRAERAHPELRFTLVPVEGPLPFADGAFELVWASEVIEHVADTARWLSEVRRVLASGGRLLLTTPNHGRMGVLLHGIERYSEPLGDHLHLYTRRSLGTVLSEFGFGEIELRAAVGLPPVQRLLLARARR
jgi:2-polyprenyl-3-methyl-5-hydroxy-6-metoxy-1,4-benzoquinol methylase